MLRPSCRHHFHSTKTLATPKLYNNSFILTFALAILSAHALRLKISLRQSPILFRILSRITRVRRRKRASHTNHTAIHSWPILLHGHSCHWYLSKLYIYIYHHHHHHHHQSGRQFACRRSSQRALCCLSPVFAIDPFHAKSVSSILSVESSFETIYTWCRYNCV